MDNWKTLRRSDLRPPAAHGIPPAPDGILRPEFAWIDVEASSLFASSYPVEVGWSFDDLSGGSFLIRPAHGWTDWHWKSELVHGIRQSELGKFGVAAKEGAWRLNKALSGKIVFCDTVGDDGTGGTDAMWLDRLFAAARSKPAFKLVSIRKALFLHAGPERDQEAAEGLAAETRRLSDRHYPATHQAGEDTVRMAALFRMAADPKFLTSVREHDGWILGTERAPVPEAEAAKAPCAD